MSAGRAAVYSLVALAFLSGGTALAQTSVLVQTAPLTVHRLAQTITAYGQVRPDPDSERSVTVPRDGQIGLIRVRLGERVRAGAPILELYTSPLVHLEYRQTQNAVAYARDELARVERLFREQLATTAQVAAARQALAGARAKLETQKRLGYNRGRATITSPFEGVVSRLLVKQGDRVQADSTVAILARGSALVVLLGVEPEDAVRIRPGMPVTLISVFDPGLRLAATIDRVHAMVNPETQLVDVLVRVPARDTGRVLLGMQIKGVITLAESTGFAVPRSAVLTDAKGAYLFVVRAGRAHRVAVRTGYEENGLVGVSGPLQAGQAVVVTGNYELRDGMPIREQHP